MPTSDEVRESLLEELHTAVNERNNSSGDLLRYAEAWAWLRSPGQSHSGTGD